MFEKKGKLVSGTPKATSSIGYSSSQMDNFYETLADAVVKPSGVMNYIQHLFIAQRCPKGASVLDVCCGRALLIPLLKRYAPEIAHYVGIDISPANLEEARDLIHQRGGGAPQFPCSLVQGDVTQLSGFVKTKFDVAVYTSALEHVDRESGIISLNQVSKVLTENGTLFLSTPRTSGATPRKLQYKVHVYEWDRDELKEVLKENGLKIVECIGLLPPPDAILESTIKSKFGTSGVAWFEEMRDRVPYAFLAPVMAACFPSVAKELLYVCRKRG